MHGAERIDALDILRGLAVLGILLANIAGFSHPGLAYYWPPAMPGGAQGADGWIWLGQLVLVDGKMRGIFTILFGAGLVLFVERAGTDGGALQLRRLAWLALLGLAHFYLLYVGDILWAYATSGMICLLTLHLSTRGVLAAGLIGAVIGGMVMLSTFLPPALLELRASPAEAAAMLGQFREASAAEDAGEAAAMMGRSFADLVQYRAAEESWRLLVSLWFNLLETIPLALIGMGLMRAGLFTDAALRRRWRRWAWTGLMLGAGLNCVAGLYVMGAGFPPYATQAVFFGVLALANLPFLLGAMLLLTDGAVAIRGRWMGGLLARPGRMALSNYVGTSLLMACVFQGWAGGLYGTLHRAELLVVVAFGWAAMLIFSHLWLTRYRQGPLEWLWRCATYRRIFPNRI